MTEESPPGAKLREAATLIESAADDIPETDPPDMENVKVDAPDEVWNRIAETTREAAIVADLIYALENDDGA